ncbi:MAG TPA: CsbD family protein [Mycobacterium sp.]
MSATDKAKNAADNLAGKAKETTGRIVGNEGLEDEGRQDQAKSDLKNAAEKVKDAFKH